MAVAVATSAEHLRAAAEIQQYKELDIMQLFEADQVEDMEKDVMVFWGSEQVQKQLPMLSQLARCYCAAPVTSVPSERVFSKGRPGDDQETPVLGPRDAGTDGVVEAQQRRAQEVEVSDDCLIDCLIDFGEGWWAIDLRRRRQGRLTD